MGELGNPERRLPPAVHIAGTNGKGSTVAFLRALLESGGHTVHTYTSPHLVRFNERIVLAGRDIADEALIAVLKAAEAANDSAEITYFEITTAAAFLAFADEPADVILLETGLGGRLDATNLLERPRLSAITPIALDHQHFLGDTMTEIAGEKAGILKPGVAAAVGPQPPEALETLQIRASEAGAPLFLYGRDWTLTEEGGDLVYRSDHFSAALPPLPLPGAHQHENAGLALACLDLLGRPSGANAACFTVRGTAIRDGLTSARWPGRLQRLDWGRIAANLPPGWDLWLDGGHNPAAGEALSAWAAGDDRPLHLVVGMLTSKDPAGFLQPLAEHAASVRAVPVPGGHSFVAPDELIDLSEQVGTPGKRYDTVEAAVADILREGDENGRILVCGSLYLVGAALAENER